MQIEIERETRFVDNQPVRPHSSKRWTSILRVSGLPHAVLNQAENSRLRELVKKMESHPHRQDLQADQQQKNAFNPFSEKSKKMIKDMGNVELFELCETIPSALQRNPSMLESRHCLLHLQASLERESIQSKYPSMDIGSSVNPELCHEEGATLWQSSWED